MGITHIKFLSVDIQNDFMSPKGIWHNHGSSPSFIQNVLFPYLSKNSFLVNEIISDYSAPRLGHSTMGCIPGTEGYQSTLPPNLRNGSQWVKAMHNPTWIRPNYPNADFPNMLPYPNPDKFTQWLITQLGNPSETSVVIVFGLTLEICVQQVCQELYFRGYKTLIPYEASDPMNERISYKELIANHSSLSLYTSVVPFEKIKEIILKGSL